MPTTFQVTNVKQNTERLPAATVLERLTMPPWVNPRTQSAVKGQSIINEAGAEAFGANTPDVIKVYAPKNGFLQAVHIAFADHYPLVLSPDDIWLAIAQGFSQHVLKNAEALRQRFVLGSKEGEKKLIEIRRDGFVKGSPHNDWPGAFDEFSAKIGENIGQEKVKLVRSNFSTTGGVEKAASEVVLMESMSAYFTYAVRTCCGIPEITLLGTVQDWKDVVARAQALAEFDLSWWVNDLVPTLDEFVRAAEGRANAKFWQSLYKESGGSGGPFVTGWINQFFPYLRYDSPRRNSYAFGEHLKGGAGWHGPSPDDLPLGLSRAPFTWFYFDQKFEMEFLGGFVGAHQMESGAIRPSIGWLVGDDKKGATSPERGY